MGIIGHLIALVKLPLFAIYTFVYVSFIQLFRHLSYYELQMTVLKWWHALTLKFLGVKVTVKGVAPETRGHLIISNHCSYIDIFVIGSLIYTHYTPKDDIRKWPILSIAVNSSSPFYINRNDRRSISKQNKKLIEFIKAGKNVTLYPEGTTTQGNEVYAFKTGAFALAEHAEISVLPVSIVYIRCDGKPLSVNEPSPVAWYGDMYFLPHLWTMLKGGLREVVVTFHDPLLSSEFSSRKELSKACEAILRQDLEDVLSSNA